MWRCVDNIHILSINDNTTISIEIEKNSNEIHVYINSFGESCPLLFDEASVEDAKINVATLLQQIGNLAISCAFQK